MINLLCNTLGIIIASVFIMRRSNWKAIDHEVDSFKGKYFPSGVFTYLIIIAVSFVYTAIVMMLFKHDVMNHFNAAIQNRERAPFVVAPLILIAFISNSIAEEITMRGILQTHLCALSRSNILGIIYVNLLFASYHIYQGFTAIIPIFILGLIFSFGRILFKSIWPSVIAHTIYNLMLTIPYMNFY